MINRSINELKSSLNLLNLLRSRGNHRVSLVSRTRLEDQREQLTVFRAGDARAFVNAP
jgi:hypothetical protein